MVARITARLLAASPTVGLVAMVQLLVATPTVGLVAMEQVGRDAGERQSERGGGGRVRHGAAALARLHPHTLQPGHRLRQPRRLQVSLVFSNLCYLYFTCIFLCV